MEKAEDWEFSSYQDYIALRRGSLPKLELLKSQLSSAEDYRYFLEDYSKSDQLIQHLTFAE